MAEIFLSTHFYLHFCEVVRKNAWKPHWVISPPIQCLRQPRHYNCQQGRAHGGDGDDFGGDDLRPNAINLKGLQWAQQQYHHRMKLFGLHQRSSVKLTPPPAEHGLTAELAAARPKSWLRRGQRLRVEAVWQPLRPDPTNDGKMSEVAACKMNTIFHIIASLQRVLLLQCQNNSGGQI